MGLRVSRESEDWTSYRSEFEFLKHIRKYDFKKFDSQKEFNWKLDECESLKRRVNELEAALDVIAEREAKNADDECKSKMLEFVLTCCGL